MNAACNTLYNTTLSYCQDWSAHTTTIEEGVALVVTVIGAELLAHAILHGSEGIIKNAIVIKELFKKFKPQRIDYDEFGVSPLPHLQNNQPLWKRSFSSVRLLTGGLLLGTIGYMGVRAGQMLYNQADQKDCTPFAEKSQAVCEWANDFLIDMIKQLLKPH